MTEKTVEWYQKELGDRFQHFYMLLDGSYNFPNSLEGDLLRMTHNMLTLMEKEDHQPTFAVGEYSVDQRGMLFDLKANFKVNKSAETAIRDTLVEYASSSLSNKEFIQLLQDFIIWVSKAYFVVGEYYASNDGDVYKIIDQEKTLISVKLYSKSSDKFLDITIPSHDPQDKPATAEQIATFQRAERFASKGREWSEFKKGDIVQNTETMQLGLVESIDEDGDAVVNYNSEGPLSIRDYKCTGALFLDLIQTAEELQEVDDGEDRKNKTD